MFGGITAGVVALPVALAFGVQSGAGAVAGLYGAASCPAHNSWLSPRRLESSKEK